MIQTFFIFVMTCLLYHNTLIYGQSSSPISSPGGLVEVSSDKKNIVESSSKASLSEFDKMGRVKGHIKTPSLISRVGSSLEYVTQKSRVGLARALEFPLQHWDIVSPLVGIGVDVFGVFVLKKDPLALSKKDPYTEITSTGDKLGHFGQKIGLSVANSIMGSSTIRQSMIERLQLIYQGDYARDPQMLQSYVEFLDDFPNFLEVLPLLHLDLLALSREVDQEPEVALMREHLLALEKNVFTTVNNIDKAHTFNIDELDVNFKNKETILKKLRNVKKGIESNHKYSFKRFKDQLDELAILVRMPTGKKKVDISGFNQVCRQDLSIESLSEDLYQKIYNMANTVSNLSKSTMRPLREFHYIYSNPGTTKTTSVIRLAKCLDVPVCVIRPSDIEFDKPKEILTIIKKKMAKCFENDFLSKEGINIKNGIVLFDDIHLVLHNLEDTSSSGNSDYSSMSSYNMPYRNIPYDNNNMMNKEELKQTRRNIFSFFKDMADPANKYLDFKGDDNKHIKLPIDRMLFVATSNELPEEFQNNNIQNSPLRSRILIYQWPYPDLKMRQSILMKNWRDFLADYKRTFKREIEDQSACITKIKEILNVDREKFELAQGQIGIRGMLQMWNYFINDLTRRVNNDRGPCVNISFRVNDVAQTIQDYQNELDPVLARASFKKRVDVFKIEFMPLLKNIPSYFHDFFKTSIEDMESCLKKANCDYINDVAVKIDMLKFNFSELSQIKDFRYQGDLVKEKYQKANFPLAYRSLLEKIIYNVNKKSTIENDILDGSHLFVRARKGEFMDVYLEEVAKLMKVPYCDLVDEGKIETIFKDIGESALKKHQWKQGGGVKKAEYSLEGSGPKVFYFYWDNDLKIYKIDDQNNIYLPSGKTLVLSPKDQRAIEVSKEIFNENVYNKEYLVKTLFSHCYDKWGSDQRAHNGIMAIKENKYMTSNDFVNVVGEFLDKGHFVHKDGKKLLSINNNTIVWIKDDSSFEKMYTGYFSTMDIDPLTKAQRVKEFGNLFSKEVTKYKMEANDLTIEKQIVSLITKIDEKYYDLSLNQIGMDFAKNIFNEYVTRRLQTRSLDEFGLHNDEEHEVVVAEQNIETRYKAELLKLEAEKNKVNDKVKEKETLPRKNQKAPVPFKNDGYESDDDYDDDDYTHVG